MSISLTYFDFDFSRGLECRLALTAAGADFEDIRIQREQWPGMKPTVPFGALPVLNHDGRVLSQSNAILRYVGTQHGLHPTDPWASAEHDAILQSVEDLRNKVPGGRDMSDEDKKTKREAFTAGFLSQWAQTLEDRIAGPFLEGDALNVADLKVYTILRAYLGGGYDFIPASHFDAYPKLKALYAAVDGHDVVTGYFASRQSE